MRRARHWARLLLLAIFSATVMASAAAQDPLPTIGSTGGEVGTLETRDGATLRYAHWPAEDDTRGTVVLFQGRTEFIEKYLEVVGELRARGFAVWTMDWRGQGLSSRALANPNKSHIRDYATYVDDADLFVKGVVMRDSPGPLVLLGHSMGSLIALRFLHDQPEVFTAAVLESPMVEIALRGAFGTLAARGLARLGGLRPFSGLYVPGGHDYGLKDRNFEQNFVTSDPERFRRTHAFIDRDQKLALGSPTLGWLHASFASIAILRDPAYAAAIRTPILVASATDDTVVDVEAERGLCEDALADCTYLPIAGSRHEILMERDIYRNRFWQMFDSFLAERLAPQ